ncbi:NADPH-dependent FMN reductase [Tenacibaculum maritimum]|uniref:FMN reductase, NADPH-dependent n=1 Tax=Tenacibaculum maritimum NCIMB 2154 TaxID=1349785 RepID=A0A2H1EAX0_9FLAO|nr:NAD(P)H-dependent oxidoreductase [Tenacibaculum maritimum]MCD9584747.1 NAD(P)H-dependent oxidoreductase [Tenacibaculum maritimum]MCD9611394.1 NAD(P)H-dependent oxidoreductase [Tenacibaculum maritimum]MCD9621639.1 NAD(P)H-dependent oxidoreductase [Tenacibaculum maritimum]MCD9626794.1 NAD(P)H-dependent oxidoreductase [Tenacibaculum maritimum]MCD9630508.1 NAD(P)H-dependent oxidoreductase [Tenacibaculum maritimum]
MKKIISFAGSNSKNSINKQLVVYASNLIESDTDDIKTNMLDLNDFTLPIYGIDEETDNGIPENAKAFYQLLRESDGIILSLAEHNGNFSVAFKNIFDWMSRIEQKFWSNIPMLLMATSPGGRGGASVLTIAKNGFPHMGGNIIADFSLPKFNENFKDGEIINESLKLQLKEGVARLQKSL